MRSRGMTGVVVLALVGPAFGQEAARLRVLSGGWPRAFFFRSAEGWAANERIGYDEWERTFARLMGIEGKVLDEEVLGRGRRNVEFFTRFKRAHPDQLVLLHYNGNARDPRYQRDEFFAGHWVYRAAVKIIADVPAEDGETDIRVADVAGFRVGAGRYRTSNDDVGLCELDADGRCDWARSEQVQLVSIDPARRAIRVRRGCYGTKPRAFAAGRSAAAAHAAEGPWGKRNHLMWFYNYSTRCPRDARGRTCSEVHAADIARRFAAGGELAAFDGLEFDVLANSRGGGLDCDADGQADDGRFDGVNTYGIGVVEFLRDLRKRLPGRLILADGHGESHQRGFGLLNGIESEGWPDLRDVKLRDWSGGLNRHFFWAANGHTPAFNYVNHKFNEPTGQPGETRTPATPFSTHRLVFAAAVFTDSALCYSFAPPKGPGELIGVWDELWMGTAKRVGWLGRPVGPAVRLATRRPDLLGGRGLMSRVNEAFGWSGGNVRLGMTVEALSIEPQRPGQADLRFRLTGVPCDGPDLFVALTMAAEPMRGYPKEMARLVHVGIAPPDGVLVRAEPPATAMCLRGGKETALDPASGASVRFQRARRLGDEAHDAYSVHPPYRGHTGYAVWWRACTVPADGRLELFCGMGEKAPQRSDGVVFRVEVAELPDGKCGEFQAVLEHTQKAAEWTPHTVRLGHLAGKRVRLRFVSDCGPRDNATTDHSYWGDVCVVGAGGRAGLTPARRFMTWANGKAFTSGFWFDDVRSKHVDLEFVVEGAEPVRITGLTAHAAPDAICREFTGGLVLANPSPRPLEFDLATLVPGKGYRRFQASALQDTATNNGKAVGAKVQLGPRDALFLVRRLPGVPQP